MNDVTADFVRALDLHKERIRRLQEALCECPQREFFQADLHDDTCPVYVAAFAERIVCPRCEGQTYDVGACVDVDVDLCGPALLTETDITTPLGRARWILATDERGTQAEIDVLDDLLDELADLRAEIARYPETARQLGWLDPAEATQLRAERDTRAIP